MARPRKEGMDYFPHDVHAANDKKVEALRMLYGNDGYAFYFILLENIYQESNFELDISDAETIQILCRKTELTKDKFDQILETALKRDCFDRESYEKRGVLTSNGIKKRAEVVVKKRVKMQDSYKESVSDSVSDIVSDAETHTETPKVKESKVKESIDIKNIKDLSAQIKDLRSRYSDSMNLVLDEYLQFIAETRSGKKIADSIVVKILEYFNNHSPVIVECAVKTHMNMLDKKSAKENYTFGILRGLKGNEEQAKVKLYLLEGSKEAAPSKQYGKQSFEEFEKILGG